MAVSGQELFRFFIIVYLSTSFVSATSLFVCAGAEISLFKTSVQIVLKFSLVDFKFGCLVVLFGYFSKKGCAEEQRNE